MKLVNHHTGQYRKLTIAGGFFGALAIGPLYLLFKGAWTWALLWFGLVFFIGLVAPPFALMLWLLGAAFAPVMVESFYRQRGFQPEVAS